jgi:acid phosphatase type 7
LTTRAPVANMPRMKSLALAVLVAAAGTAHATAVSFSRQPFTQRVTTTDVILKWAQSSGSATITYGPKGGATMMTTDAAVSTGRHELHLTGLTASTRYAYTVDLGGGLKTSGEFSTAATASQPFSFIVYGDDRTNDADHQTVVNAMANESVDFLVQTGDVIENATAAEYDNFFKIEQALLAENVLFTTLGNHEYDSGSGVTLWKQQFYVPDGSYYSFDYGNSRFVVLDFNANTSAQATWLDGVLADARNKGLVHLFAFMHSSPYDSGTHGNNTTAQTEWVPVFQKYNLDMIFGGHDHDYEHGVNPTTHLSWVITGGGGAPLYADNSMQPGQLKFESTLNYVKVSVSGEMVTMTAMRPDGSQIESFSFSPGSSSVSPDMGSAPSTTTTTGGTTGATTGSTTGTTTGGATGSTTGGSTTGGSTTGGSTTGGSTSGSASTGSTSGGRTSSGGCEMGGSASSGLVFAFALVGIALLRRRRV